MTENTVLQRTTRLTRPNWKGERALPHRSCSGSQLFCTSDPTAPLRHIQIQSEAVKTREAERSSVACCDITFSLCDSARS